jgi:zinc protease
MKMIPALLCTLLAAPSVMAAETSPEQVTVYAKKPKQPLMKINVPEYALQTMDFHFPSGLRVLMQADNSYPIATIMSVVDHGSVSDPIGKEGIAHFVEHAWFRSRHGDLPPIMDVIQDMGCPFNATTRPDWTDYRTVCASRLLPSMLRLESLRLTDTVAGVSESDIDTEREVVRNELRQSMEQGSQKALEYLYAHLYPEGHPYARLTIGAHQSLDNAKLVDIAKFTDDYYRADTTTMMVVGDFDPEEATSLLYENMELSLLHPDLTDEHLFQYVRQAYVEDPENPGFNMDGDPFVAHDPENPDHFLTGARDPDNSEAWLNIIGTPKSRLPAERAEPPPLGDREPGHYEAAVSRKSVLIGWSLPAGFRDDELNYQFLGLLAGNVINNHFIKSYSYSGPKYQDGVAGAGCWYNGGRYGASIVCFIELTDDSLDGEYIAQQAIDQLPMIWNPDMVYQLQYDFSRVKMEYVANTLQSLDLISSVMEGRANDIVVRAHLSGDARAHTIDIQNAMNLHPQEVANLGNQYLRRDRAAVVILDKLPENDIVKDSSDSAYHAAQRGDDLARGDDLDQVTDDQIRNEALRPDMTRLRDVTLDNGLRVLVMPQGEAPIVQATMVFNGGRAMQPNGMGGFTQDFHQGEREDALQFAGQWGGSQTSNSTYKSIRAPSGNLDGALWSMRTHIDSLAPELSYKSMWLKQRKKGLKSSWRSSSYWMGYYQTQHIHADHPLGLSQYPTWEDYDAMQAWGSSEVADTLARMYQPANATLIIVGPVDPDEAIELSKMYLSGWEAIRNVEVGPWPELPPPAESGETKIWLLNEPKNTQTQITMLCPLQPGDATTEAARQVLTKQMSDTAFKTLRVSLGATYGAYAFSQSQPNGGSQFGFSALTTNARVAESIAVFQQLTENAESGQLETNTMRQSKLRLVRQANVSSQSASQMTGALMEPLRWGNDPRSIEDATDQIVNVTIDDMVARIQGCSDHTFFALQGPQDTLGPQLDEAGIEYELIDARQAGDEMLLKYDPQGYKKMMKKREKSSEKREKEDDMGDEGSEE